VVRVSREKGSPSGASSSGSRAVKCSRSGNGPYQEKDQRAIACFDQAMTDVGLTAEPLRQRA
jgi:hemoglobin